MRDTPVTGTTHDSCPAHEPEELALESNYNHAGNDYYYQPTDNPQSLRINCKLIPHNRLCARPLPANRSDSQSMTAASL